MILSILLWGLVAILVLVSVLPLAKIRHGLVRGCEFPREQLFVFAVLTGLLFALFSPTGASATGAGLAFAAAAVQLAYIAKFTPIWRRQSIDATAEEREHKDTTVSFLAANVKKSNRDYDRLIALVEAQQPDIVMAIEVDEDWISALQAGVSDRFEHQVTVPMDNGYGLALLSKLPVKDAEVRELVTEGVPSIRTAIALPDGQRIRLYVVHPEPPVPSHDTVGRDSEIALIGLEAADDDLPSVVAGDLNDVAWSTTTRRFQRLSGLLDPRVGRGFYNTFSATMPWMRWPLDHLFHDPMFRLVEMARLPKIGSDHFPMWFVLTLAQSPDSAASVGEASTREEMQTKRMIVEERERDREALGSDWEDE